MVLTPYMGKLESDFFFFFFLLQPESKPPPPPLLFSLVLSDREGHVVKT